ncbi:uncharacterized protein KZ484_003382 isoform 1-T1 [Pholidichthys leucotaenia]
MRSFTHSQSTAMDRLLCFSLLFSHLPGIDSMGKRRPCVSQLNKTIWTKEGHSVDLHCSTSPNCSAEDLHIKWFIFKEKDHTHLNLDSEKYSLIEPGGSLHIKFLNANDSGIYHCAAWPIKTQCCTHFVAQGETLVVTGKNAMARQILLWSSFVLLTIYSLAIVILIILKKYGYNMNIRRSKSKTDKKTSKRKAQFRDVLQEMYSKRNLEKSKKIPSRNTSRVEVGNNEINNSCDDIYQNV